MKIVVEKELASRAELDAYIRTTFGDDMNANKSIALEIPEEQLTILALSADTTVFGVKVRPIKSDKKK